MRAMRTMRARRKTLSNISLSTINFNSIPCQALQYIKYYLVKLVEPVPEPVRSFKWAIGWSQLKFVTNQTIYSTAPSLYPHRQQEDDRNYRVVQQNITAANNIEGSHDSLLVVQTNPQIIMPVGKPYECRSSYLGSNLVLW